MEWLSSLPQKYRLKHSCHVREVLSHSCELLNSGAENRGGPPDRSLGRGASHLYENTAERT